MIENKELSEREQEILKLVATGASNKEISRQLTISENTTKVHLRNIFSKLGVASRTEATLYAIRQGLVEHPAAPIAPATPPLIEEGVSPRSANPWRRWTIALAIALPLVVILFAASLSFQPQPPTVSASPSAVISQPNRWKVRASMPTARASLAVAAYENRIYAIGGEGAAGLSAANERYDPTTDAWEELAPMPTALSDVSAAAIGGRVYVPGGKLASGRPTTALSVYDPIGNKWESRAPLPIGLSAYALTAFEGKLYLFGGWDGERFVAAVYEYDPELDTWRIRAAMPTVRGYAGAVIAGGRIFVLGGFDGKRALATNEEYSPTRDDGSASPWTPRHNLPSPRYGMGAASVADFIYVIGGSGNAPTTSSSMQYIYQSDSWNLFDGPQPQIWSGIGVAAVQTQLYTLGGRLGPDLTTQNYAYQAIYTIFVLPGQ